MNKLSIGFLAMTTGSSFMLGFVLLFVLQMQALSGLDNECITSYNTDSNEHRAWINLFTYIIPGTFNVATSILLFLRIKKPSNLKLGLAMLALAGLIWLSFGLVEYVPGDTLSVFVLLNRTLGFIVLSLVALPIIGNELSQMNNDKILKYITFIPAGVIGILSFLSAFVFEDQSWIRTNASLIIYFVWFGALGMRFFQGPLAH